MSEYKPKKPLKKKGLKHKVKEYLLGSHNHTTNKSGRGMQETIKKQRAKKRTPGTPRHAKYGE